jgi:hypothetical protein
VSIPTAVYGEGVVIPLSPGEERASAWKQFDGLPVPPANVWVERRVEEGDAVEAILRVAQEVRADLLVMGTHGRTGLGRLLMGSVAEQVVRKAACPVLTVKAPFPQTAPEELLAAAGAASG